MVDVERRSQSPDDISFNVTRARVLAPRHTEVLAHPLRESCFIVVDKNDAIGPAGPILLLIEEQAGECASKGRAATPTQVVGGESRAELRREADVEKPQVRHRRMGKAWQTRQDGRRRPPGVDTRRRGGQDADILGADRIVDQRVDDGLDWWGSRRHHGSLPSSRAPS
ncbi:hypothetical protein WJX68_16175 [Pseudonocardia sp. DW16-2]|uniref:Uncharacterized protein n=1 Tax=Pseudonocardia spirodelae TaxID=3133431 RepID=A0ABU8T945_9PSEU